MAQEPDAGLLHIARDGLLQFGRILGAFMRGIGKTHPAFALLLWAWFVAFMPTAWAIEPSYTLKALQDQSAELYRAGSYREALRTAKEALALTIKEYGPNHEQTAVQAYGVGFAAEAAGDFAEAARQYAESVRIREAVYGADSAGVATAIERLAYSVLKTGRPAEAEALFNRELKIWRDLVGEHAITADAYGGLGAVNLARGDFSTALAYYREAVKKITSQTAAQALARSVIEADVKRHREVFIGLARAASGLGRQSGGDRGRLMDETFAAGQRAWATSSASALAKMTARLKAGETELGRAIRRLDGLTERILTLHDEDMKALAAWSEVQQADPAYREILTGFRAASIAQAKTNAPVIKRQRELIDRLQELLKRCPSNEARRGCETADADRNTISKELGALSAQASQGAGEINQLSHRLQIAEQRLSGYSEFNNARTERLAESQRLESELSRLRGEIVKRFPDYLSLAEPAPLTVAETQKLLHEDEALIAILVGPQTSLIWAVTRAHADWAEIDLGEAGLAVEVTALRRGLDPLAQDSSDGPTGFDFTRAHNLYKLLLSRFSSMLSGKKHLLLIPTGPLSSLPFQVLLTEAPATGLSRQEALKQAHWLIKRHALSVLPSVQSLSALRKLSASGVAVKPFFGMGDPIFGHPLDGGRSDRSGAALVVSLSSAYRNGVADLRLLQNLPQLPETAGELRAVGHTLGAAKEDISLREAATEAHVKSAPLKDYRILHFATHGLVAGELSGLNEPALVLTLPIEPTETDDGLLTASEVSTLQLNADWVVLSACNTAAGNRVGADALSGLARAFFFAGARALLVSHWAVNSQAAVSLTTRTFANLATSPHRGKAIAFQHAMLALIEQGYSPGYWAPFIIVGEGGAPSNVRE
jgi:CHAT domain-containing protein